MRDTAIARALAELERWKRRRDELRAELQKVERQVAYYEALTQDMKKEIRPARTGDLFASLFRR